MSHAPPAGANGVTVQRCIDSRRQSVNKSWSRPTLDRLDNWIRGDLLRLLWSFASGLSLFTGGNHAGMKGPFAVLGQGQSSLSWFSWFCSFCSLLSSITHHIACICSTAAQCLTDYRSPTRRHTAQAPPQHLHAGCLQNQTLTQALSSLIVLDSASFAGQVIDQKSPAASAPDWGSVRH